MVALDTAVAASTALDTRPPARRRGARAHFTQFKWLYLLLLPGAIYFALFRYGPMYGAVIAFKDYVPFLGINDSPWVGWAHFEDFFASPDFPRLLANTLILALLSLLVAFPLTIVVALLLNELRVTMVKRSVQTLIYIPHFLSWTVVASLTYLLFALDIGPLFQLINGVLGTNIDFLTDPGWFRPIIVLQDIWKNTGWGTIIFLAALAGVDQEQYEAAIIDGAGRFQRVWHITIPSIMPTIIVMLVLQMGQVLNTGFEQIYLMTNALNRSVADVFDTYVYFMGITQGSYSYSTAVGLFKAIVGVVLIFGANWLARRFNQTGIF
ncbi:ABC transporter permease subunit [Agromyces atrinae]|uniref:Putative aldouronate transport system permease protein n=1 Tax=Agromyces atrinae TaxID=592376 RepID=A0A4Q2M5R9_9MICO|nr:ABC transporter permease subunit [Agromyces atrinae]MCI2957635.1 ABC transporter permease subunit [Agromyces atrinae]NYD67056.1 putative aldouronate transport system permease protein [Agromyces atrinae]RXZ85221.1 sugar ABC transporter permease [Agromyces atrinae]RXZ85329.1 sugar ABC transporter permease [Agromyces atrinae]